MTSEATFVDKVLLDVAEYVDSYEIQSAAAREISRYCLIDSLGCAFEALDHEDCTRLLGPTVPGTAVPHGAPTRGSLNYG